MSGVAATAGAATIQAAGAQPAGTKPPSAVKNETRRHAEHDDEIAARYCEGERQFIRRDGTLAEGPVTAMFLHGLMCADMKGSEALLPNSSDCKYKHRARLHTSATPSRVDGQQLRKRPSNDGLTHWDIEGYAITIQGFANEVETTGVTSCEKGDRGDRHPWVRFSAVRSLKELTGYGLIKGDLRENCDHVVSRVTFPGGFVEPGMPVSELGRWAEWYAERPKRAFATTDTLLHIREWSKETTKVRVVFRPLRSPKMCTSVVLEPGFVEFAIGTEPLVFAVTHAVPQMRVMSPTLDDTKAYKRILAMPVAEPYPVPKLVRGCYGELGKKRPFNIKIPISSRDGHCEISWDGEG